MRIGLDARSLTAPRPRGTGRNLLDAYRQLTAMRPGWEFVLFHQRPLTDDAPAADLAARPNVTLRRIDVPGDRLDAWFQLALPLAARRARVDLLHLPANAAPAWLPVPAVVTIHDLAPLTVPGELPPAATARFRRGVRRAVRRAAHLIAVSESTRTALQELLGVPPHRVSVVPWAPDALIAAAAGDARRPARRTEICRRYGLAGRWLLAFSGWAPRKNALGLLTAFARLPAARRADVQLVLVGCEPAERRAELCGRAENLGVAAACRILGYVPHADLPALLANACGLAMPSLCEGFGLPLLDAMACDVPILTSNRSSMPEIAGDAALFCDPTDPDSIAAGLAALLEPAAAARLVARGRARVRRFTWKRTAAALCRVYERTAGARAPRAAEALRS